MFLDNASDSRVTPASLPQKGSCMTTSDTISKK
ncbi:hypothetical protein F383_38608 [Gossypium arboreum]|uniref:Uncharacterized protein n=1 Tax=Gossypium arboreum TaxID=29729 RepID=A0A0B0MHI1_GOSAR|nr:hypothetical protein F383_38608 [Gossypium arboreum]